MCSLASAGGLLPLLQVIECINEVLVFVAILSRNHNVLDAYDQDPGVWAGGRVARAARAALTVKGSGAWC